MRWLIAGILLFSAVTGFLSGTNNTPLLSNGLFAISGAIVAALAWIQKLYADRRPPEVTTLAPGAETLRMSFSTQLAESVGKVLMSLSAGYLVGLAVGVSVHDRYPLLLTDKLPVTIPWDKSAMPPKDVSHAVGWLALSQRLRQAAASEQEIRGFYETYRESASSGDYLNALGKQWLERADGAKSGGQGKPAAESGKPADSPGAAPDAAENARIGKGMPPERLRPQVPGK